MAALDPGIISQGQQLYQPKPLSALLAAKDAVEAARAKQAEARQKAETEAKYAQAAQEAGGNPDTFASLVERFDPEGAAKYRGIVSDSQQKAYAALTEQTKLHQTQLQMGLAQARLVHDQATYDIWRKSTSAYAPEVVSQLPNDYGDGSIMQHIQQIGETTDNYLKEQQTANDAIRDGQWDIALGGHLALAQPQERETVFQTATKMGTPQVVIDKYRAIDPNAPDYAARVKAMMAATKEGAAIADKEAGRNQKSYQSKDVMVNGRRAIVNFDPKTAKYFDQGGNEITGVTPIPPASESGGVGGAAGLLTPGAIQRAGAAFRLLGSSSIPTRIGEVDRTRIMNEADKQETAIGQSPVATIQRQLALKADAPALALVRKQEAGTVAAESKALKQIDLIKSISPQVPRTDWNFVNTGIQSFREQTGNTPAIKLANAIITFSSEYGKIVEGSTGSVAGASDSARAAASRLVNAAQSQKTLDAVVEQMKTEMAYAKEGWGASADSIIERMGGGESGATVPRGTGGDAKDPLGILGKP